MSEETETGTATEQDAGEQTAGGAPPRPRPVARELWRRERRRRLADRLYQLLDFAFSLLYAVLGLRLLLGLVAANENAGFVRLIARVTQPFYAPFAEIVRSPRLERGTLDLSLLFALCAYLLLHLAARRLLHLLLGTRRPT